MAYMGDVVRAVAALLEAGRDELDAAMMAAAGVPMGAILPYFSSNLDVDSYPALMVSESAETRAAHAMPAVYREAFVVNVWGMVHHDDEAIRQAGCLRLAHAVKVRMNARHQGIEIKSELGYVLEFEGPAPISEIVYQGGPSGSSSPLVVVGGGWEVKALQRPFVSAFRAVCSGVVIVGG